MFMVCLGVNAMSQKIWQSYDKLVGDHLKLVGGACSARAVNGRSKNEAALAAVLLLTWKLPIRKFVHGGSRLKLGSRANFPVGVRHTR
jgi:hypothetical protein